MILDGRMTVGGRLSLRRRMVLDRRFGGRMILDRRFGGRMILSGCGGSWDIGFWQ